MKAATIRTTVFICGLAMTASVGMAGRAAQFSRKSKATPQTTTTSRPEGTVVPGDRRVRSTRSINRKMIEVPMARSNSARSPITVTESREKNINVYRTRDITRVDSKAVRRAGDEVSIPRMSNDEFQTILKRYQKGMDRPIDTRKSSIADRTDRISLDEINKYSDASESVDSEGVPVVRAGREETKP